MQPERAEQHGRGHREVGGEAGKQGEYRETIPFTAGTGSYTTVVSSAATKPAWTFELGVSWKGVRPARSRGAGLVWPLLGLAAG